jgi:competence protein ComGC
MMPPRPTANYPQRLTTTARAFTRIDGLVLIIVIALCIILLILTLARRQELIRRVQCGKNLNMIVTACWMYAGDNQDDFPVAAHPEPLDDLTAGVDYTRAIGSYRGRADNPSAGNIASMQQNPTKLSTTRSLWLLVRSKHIEPKSFICPSTQDRPNTDTHPAAYWDFGVGDITGPATPEQVRQGYSQISYGYEVSFGKHGKPNMDHDRNIVLAEKGPFGAAIETSIPAPPPFPTGTFTSFTQVGNWRPWNSPNHGGDGQHQYAPIGFVEWNPYPISIALISDNIYTRWSANRRLPNTNTILGQPPTLSGKETPSWDPTVTSYVPDQDTLIYP